jgi:hypothetical protein
MHIDTHEAKNMAAAVTIIVVFYVLLAIFFFFKNIVDCVRCFCPTRCC